MAQDVEKRRGGKLSVVDKGLVVAGVIGGVLVVMWVVGAVAHVVLDVFKFVVLVVVVALAVRLVRLFTRRR